MKCQYSVGEEGYRKFWCRGSDWKDCARVIETGQEVGQEVRHGRVTLRDNPTEHHFLVITEDLKEEDVDVYWCGVDGARSVPQAPAVVAVSPGNATSLPWLGVGWGWVPLAEGWTKGPALTQGLAV